MSSSDLTSRPSGKSRNRLFFFDLPEIPINYLLCFGTTSKKSTNQNAARLKPSRKSPVNIPLINIRNVKPAKPTDK